MGFRANVLEILDNKGLTQSDLALRLGKSQPNVSMLLKKDKPSHNTILEFAKALDVDPSELLEEEDDVISKIKESELSENAYQRLFDYFHAKNFHPDDISEKMGVSYIRLYNNAVRKQDMDAEIARKIGVFEDLNVTWILTGQGEMLIPIDLGPWEWENHFKDPQEYYKRLWQFLSEAEVPLQTFFERTGNTPEFFLMGIEGKAAADADDAIKVSSAFPEVNFQWLLTGKGEMLNKQNVDSKLSRKSKTDSDFALLTSKEGAEFRAIPNSSSILLATPLIHINDREAYLELMGDESFLSVELSKHSVVMPQLTLGTFRSFEDVDFAPHVDEGNIQSKRRILTGRKIERFSKRAMEFLKEGEYIIVEEKAIFICPVVGFNPMGGIFTCFANDIEDVFEINVNDIKELYVVEVVTTYIG